MSYAAFDIGTTHIKYGVFDEKFQLTAQRKKPNRIHRHADGYDYYDFDEMIDVCRELMIELKEDNASVEAIGITGMSETGIMLDPITGKVLSPMITWYDPISMPAVDEMLAVDDAYAMFERTGLYVGAKLGLSKLLWMRSRYGEYPKNAVWLPSLCYLAWWLTGELGTDPTIALRSFAWDMNKQAYAADFLRDLNLETHQFAPVLPVAGAVGRVRQEIREQLGMGAASVTVAGHDHVCSCLAVEVCESGQILDSMGTAEALVGLRPMRALTREDYRGGIQWGPFPVDGIQFGLAGTSTSGGSVEWLRRLNPFFPLEYKHIDQLEEMMDLSPTHVLYYPYLSGRGAPYIDDTAAATFTGIDRLTTLVDLYKAISQGISMEIRLMLEFFGIDIQKITAVGGGTRNHKWMQIKSNIMDIRVEVPTIDESALTGAAVVASVTAGHYHDLLSAVRSVKASISSVYTPDKELVAQYDQVFKQEFIKMDRRIYNHPEEN